MSSTPLNTKDAKLKLWLTLPNRPVAAACPQLARVGCLRQRVRADRRPERLHRAEHRLRVRRGIQHVEAAAGEQALAGTDQRSRGAAEGGEPARVLTITILSACLY